MIDGVTFKVGGTAHTLRMTTMAMVRVEKALGAKISDILADLPKGLSAEFVHAAFAAGLNDGKGMEAEEAGAVLDAFGGIFGGAGQIVTDALTLALPKRAEPAPEPGPDAEVPQAGKRKTRAKAQIKT